MEIAILNMIVAHLIKLSILFNIVNEINKQ